MRSTAPTGMRVSYQRNALAECRFGPAIGVVLVRLAGPDQGPAAETRTRRKTYALHVAHQLRALRAAPTEGRDGSHHAGPPALRRGAARRQEDGPRRAPAPGWR